MNCDFKVKYDDGQNTYFREKIVTGLMSQELPIGSVVKIPDDPSFGKTPFYPKITTIRKGKRWRKGHKIHMTNYGRSKRRVQFALIECKSIQDIEFVFHPKLQSDGHY